MDSIANIKIHGVPIQQCMLPSKFSMPCALYPRMRGEGRGKPMHGYICNASCPDDVYLLLHGFVRAYFDWGCEPLHIVECELIGYSLDVECHVLTNTATVEELREQIRKVKTDEPIDKDVILQSLRSVYDIDTEVDSSSSSDESESEEEPVLVDFDAME